MQSDENYSQRRLLQYHQQTSFKNAQQITATQPHNATPISSPTPSPLPPSAISSSHPDPASKPPPTSSSSASNYKLDTNPNERYSTQPIKPSEQISGSDKTATSQQQQQQQNERYYFVPNRYTNIPCAERYASSNHYCHKNTPVSSNTSPHCEQPIYEQICPTRSNKEAKTDIFYSPPAYNDVACYQDQNKSNSNIFIPPAECFSSGNLSYMAPPSPAPCDRFIPPSPLSPSGLRSNSSSDCYPNNAFPSPSPKSERSYPLIERCISQPSDEQHHFSRSPKKLTFPSASSDRLNINTYEGFEDTSTYLACSTPITSTYTDRYIIAQERNYHDRLITPNTQTLPSNNTRYSTNSNRYSLGSNYSENRYTFVQQDRLPIPQADRYQNRFPNSEMEQFKPNYTSKVERFSDRYATLPNLHNDRYNNKQDIMYPNHRYTNVPETSQSSTDQRTYHVPSSAHTPVERYVPQTSGSNENYKYNSNIHCPDRYMQPSTEVGCTVGISPSERYAPTNSGDPYMRRDLGYHHHYRPQAPPQKYYQYQANHYHRVRYANNQQRAPRCCAAVAASPYGQDHNYSSPSSSSSNSVASAGCTDSYTCILSPSQQMRIPKVQCVKHICAGSPSPSTNAVTPEYVGASGGRLISSSSTVTAMPISSLQQHPQPIEGCGMNHCGGTNCDTTVQCNSVEQQIILEQTKTTTNYNSCASGKIPNVCCSVVAAAGNRKAGVQPKMSKSGQSGKYNQLNTSTGVVNSNLHNMNSW